MKRTLLLALCLALLSTVSATAQHKVSGRVTDPSGEPFVGVVVKELGSPQGVVTDANGQYELTTEKEATLSVLFIGYEEQQYAVEGRSQLDITIPDPAASKSIDKTLYLVDGKPVSKQVVDRLPAESVKNMNIMRGVENVVLVTTRSEDVVVVGSPLGKQTEQTTIRIDKRGDGEVEIDERLKGTTIRIRQKPLLDEEGKVNDKVKASVDPLFVVKYADGTIRGGGNITDFKPEDIRLVTVYKDGKAEQFKQYGDTSHGVVYIELK